ncbi:MAG: hypothetical protein J2P25_22100 [Nocardiopsaceae bacterium]|nr:hypothetical protein [Nocardiopsaceae bacterium]
MRNPRVQQLPSQSPRTSTVSDTLPPKPPLDLSRTRRRQPQHPNRRATDKDRCPAKSISN